jgi:hypothetical protein
MFKNIFVLSRFEMWTVQHFVFKNKTYWNNSNVHENLIEVYNIVIKFVSDWWFSRGPPPGYNWNFVKSGIQAPHNQPTNQYF